MSTFTNHHVGSTTSMNHQLRLPHLWHPSSVPHADNGIMSSIDVSQYKEGAPPPSANVSSLEENTRMGLRRRRHHHRFLHRQYRVQEIRRHSNFHSYVTASPYRVPETTNHSRSSSMPIQNVPNRDNMHNLHPPAFRDEYKNKEEIGILQCGHEYHGECIKRWLHEKNVCPMCKSKGLTIE
ncbi:hypothetical protein VIGAN_01402200 [Vigna angularis var. angularis]|uniref:RING-type E3 ubiquitin transferase n=1 Tax=Vigna angularis var. angularis TaxID=157739 RepID=A0A0S3R5W2_PHAAN|nr:hypothetical protein VIGAN_01402200 [Vigna angularis var. angularis]